MYLKKLTFLSLTMIMTPVTTQAEYLLYVGEIAESTAAFAALTPVGAPVTGAIEVDSAALAAGSIGTADISSINFNAGVFCFATAPGDCAGVGTLVTITSIDNAAITGSSGQLGGSFAFTAYSPTIALSIPFSFNLEDNTFIGNGFGLGTLSGEGSLNVALDSDSDGVSDHVDNCTLRFNPAQIDSNSDGIGNQCDADVNNDCIVNFIDLSQFALRFNSSDGDMLYDEDYDINSSGALNFLDYIAYVVNFNMPPGPGANPCIPAPLLPLDGW